MADSIRGRFHLRKIDPQIAGTGADGRRGKDVPS